MNRRNIMNISIMLNLSVILAKVIRSLDEEVNFENIVLYYSVSQNFNLNHFYLNYIQKWFPYISYNRTHFNYSFGQIRKRLSSSKLKTEVETHDPADAWIKHDKNQKSKHSISLLKLVCLPLLSRAALDKLRTIQTSFVKFHKCKKFIRGAVSFDEQRTVDAASTCRQNRYYNKEDLRMLAVVL